MQIVEQPVNLTRDPTQYFALGNKMKQISEMRDYIKVGKRGLPKDCVTEHTGMVMNK